MDSMKNVIQNKTAAVSTQDAPKKLTLNEALSNLLDGQKMRSRFDELLGDRAPQFISSLVTLINADAGLQRAFAEAPMTVVQSALKAATFDLPIDPSLGYAYIVAFKNNKKNADGSWSKVTEAEFIPGWKGYNQLALRTGLYKTINVTDVREGELIENNRLTGELSFEFIDDDEVREKLPIIGYAGYYKLVNGAEKMIYMTKKEIERHEEKNRKGKEMGKGWRDNWEEMAWKTVFRRLIGKYGVMSIEYRKTESLADAIRAEDAFDDAGGAGSEGYEPDFAESEENDMEVDENGEVQGLRG